MDVFTKFKQSLKIREVLVDNHVFQLHYRVTAVLLVCCAGLVASKQHFGDPIDCITRDDVPNKIMDTYCWIHATFTLPSACNKTVGIEVAHPCVDKFSNNEERVYHKYYQWVYFVLFFQAVFFYAPHFFWKTCESKLLRKLTDDLRDPLFKQDNTIKSKALDVVTYLERHKGQHQSYYYCFVMFEVSNFLNVIMQMYVVDQFLGGTFTSYGLDVLEYSQMEQDDRIDPMVRVFPRMTKCTFHRFGSSGDVQTHDALCILPLNIINEKIYIIMWFWFVFLACVTAVWLVYRLLTFLRPELRFKELRQRASLTSSRRLRAVLDRSQSGDWFLLLMMCKNMGGLWFRFIIEHYSDRLEAKEPEVKRAARGSLLEMGQAMRRRQRSAHDNGKQPMLENFDEQEPPSEDNSSDLEGASESSTRSNDPLRRMRETFDGVVVEPTPQKLESSK